jgi:hypothetical protein
MRRSIFWVMIFASLIISLIILRSTSAHEFAASIHVWKSYTNIRYQYAICYPEDLLIPQGESPNNDGQTFLAEDGAQLVVFGQNNALKESLKDALVGTESRLAGASGKVTYKVLKPKWFVVSGKNGQTVFYATTRYNGDQFKSFELTYDHSAANVYEPLIDQLTTCFSDLTR